MYNAVEWQLKNTLNKFGTDIKINNEDARAIIQKVTMRNAGSLYDDKEIITYREELIRGQYIQYNDLCFILLNEINDKMYKSYYKGIIRRCNYDIKVVMDGQLYLFYAIVESEKFSIDESKLINTLANTLTVTLPLTNTSKMITEGLRFIKFGKVWEITGIDYTQSDKENGLIILHCEVGALDPNQDDKTNEIANRYDTGGNDLLNGNIEPIYPLDVVKPLPEPPVEPEPEEPPLEDNFTIEIEGQDNINRVNSGTYTAKLLNNGVEVDGKEFTFTLSNTLAFFGEQTENTIVVKANENWKYGQVVLTATLIDDETIFSEKTINVTGL